MKNVRLCLYMSPDSHKKFFTFKKMFFDLLGQCGLGMKVNCQLDENEELLRMVKRSLRQQIDTTAIVSAFFPEVEFLVIFSHFIKFINTIPKGHFWANIFWKEFLLSYISTRLQGSLFIHWSVQYYGLWHNYWCFFLICYSLTTELLVY